MASNKSKCHYLWQLTSRRQRNSSESERNFFPSRVMNCSRKSFSCWMNRRSLHAHTVCINYHRHYYFFHVPLCSEHKLNLVHHVNSSWSNFFSVAVALAKTFVVYNARRRRFFHFFLLSISKVKSFQFACIRVLSPGIFAAVSSKMSQIFSNAESCCCWLKCPIAILASRIQGSIPLNRINSCGLYLGGKFGFVRSICLNKKKVSQFA